MLKDFKYIIKRIIIGVGICLVLSLIRGNLFIMANAQSYNYIPNDIIIASDYNVQYSTTTYTWWNNTYYGFPNNTPTDWSPSNTNIYFRYPQFSGSVLCASTSNNGSISGVIANGSRNIDVVPIVRFEDVTNNMYYSCQSSFDGQLLSFNCNNVNLSHPLNIVLSNATPGIWGIKRQLEINCSMTNEGLANSINQNQNQNTQNIINNQNRNNQNIINNNNANTETITNNQNQNAQDIIDNQNTNSEKEIESQKVCSFIDKNSIVLDNKVLGVSGQVNSNDDYGITDYFKVYSNTIITRKVVATTGQNARYCFYNINKSLIDCFTNYNLPVGNISIPNDASFVRFSIQKSENKPQFDLCNNGNQALNDTLNDDNVSSTTGSSFFNDFQANSHGLSGIITAPLRLIQSFSSSTCSSLVIPLPFVSNNVTLPCMSTIYNQFPTFYSLWQLITTGLIAYWVLIKIFGHIKGMQNPSDDRIEVVDL